jgi:hypothetical protein
MRQAAASLTGSANLAESKKAKQDPQNSTSKPENESQYRKNVDRGRWVPSL